MLGHVWPLDAAPFSNVRRPMEGVWMVVCVAATQAMWVSAGKNHGFRYSSISCANTGVCTLW